MTIELCNLIDLLHLFNNNNFTEYEVSTGKCYAIGICILIQFKRKKPYQDWNFIEILNVLPTIYCIVT